jgi:polar amino acid transport system substrate-binding protein
MYMRSYAQDVTNKGADDMPTGPAKMAFRRAKGRLFAGGCVLAVALCSAMVCAAPTLQPPSGPTPVVSTVPAIAPDLRAPDIKAILDRGELIVAMTEADQPPFYYVGPDGQLAGLDATLARDIASRLGVKASFNRSPKSFNDVVELIAQGGADVAISKLSRTLIRAQMVRFTRPYVTFRHAMLFNRLKLAQHTSEKALPQLLRGLKGHVGVIGQSSYEGFLSQYFPGATAVPFTSWEEAVDAVFAGTILAVYRDELEIQKINQSRQDASLMLKTVVYKDIKDYIAMAVAWNRPHLAAWLDIYLDTFATDQRAADIIRIYGPTKEKS